MAWNKIQEAIPVPEYLNASSLLEAYEDGEISEDDLFDNLLVFELEDVSYQNVLDIIDGCEGPNFQTFDSKIELIEYIDSIAAEFTDSAADKIREFIHEHNEMLREWEAWKA